MRKILLFLTACCATLFGAAQVPNSLAFPSANNSFLGFKGAATTGVDLYSGTAQTNIPICTLGLQESAIPISLSYISGRGVKVQDYAGSTGLGWQLNAGGAISRVVRGYPDERPNGYLGTSLWGQHIASWRNNGTALSSQVSGINGSSYSTPSADGEPDIFFLKTPFFSVQFVFDETGVPVFSNSTGLKVIPTNFYNSSSYTNSSFQVIDEQGNRFYFGGTVEQTTATLYGTSYTFPSTWYLTSIVFFNNKETVNFYYTNSSSNDVQTHYQSMKTFNSFGCSSTDNTPGTNTIVQPKFISSITSSTGEVHFNYAFDRRDLVNSARLVSLTLSSKNSLINTDLQTFGFNYSYFGDPSSNANMLRLRLDKITVAGNTPVTAAPVDMKTFTYYTTENLPVRSSQEFDYWGYYTSFTAIGGSTDPMQYPQLREPNLNRTKANVLTSVKDMSGGTYEIDYELNTYYKTSTSSNQNVGGLRVKTIYQKLTTGEVLQADYSYNDATGKSNGQILTASYANLVNYWPGQGISQVLSETPSNVYDLNGTLVGYSSVKTTAQNGGYTVSNFTNFSDFQDDINYVNGYDPNTIPNISSSTSRAYKRGILRNQIAYNANGNKISEDINNAFSSLTSPVVRKAWAFHWYLASYNVCSSSGYTGISGTYSADVENYRVTQTTHKDYDQVTPANYVANVTDYTYASNKRLVKTASSVNSKGITETKTFYYPEDMDLSGNGIPMLTGIDQQSINVMVLANRTNVLIHQTDTKNGLTAHLHNTYLTKSVGSTNKVFISAISGYNGSTLVKQQQFNYEFTFSNLMSTNEINGKNTSYLYGYNEAYPIARIDNAYNYETLQPSYSHSIEFFYEGFEQDNGYIVPDAHTGNAVYTGGYTVSFTPPNGRSYVIQWWSQSGGVWTLNEQVYTGSITISGTIDDVRIFPSDAHINTYTYDPLVGKTGEIDPSGRTTTYEYDGMGRLTVIRDNEKNIIKKICYNSAGQTTGCALFANSLQSGDYTRNTCSGGYPMSATYSVPAGKYYSEVSQADADQQALSDISANGQAYANSHAGCTVYVRLSKENVYKYYDSYYTYENADFYYRFYSDAAGTIPYTLNNQLVVNNHYRTTQQIWPSYYYQYNNDWATTVDPGVSEYYLTWEETVNCTTGPNYYDYSCTTVEITMNSGNYTIIN